MQPALVISGPSGVGKTWLARYLIERYPFRLLLSTMTRDMRPGEVNQVDNDFVTVEQYDKLKRQGDLLTDLAFLGQHYGYRRSLLAQIRSQQKIPTLIVFTPLADQVIPFVQPTVGIFLQPSSVSLLRDRMLTRGDAAETVAKRLIVAEEEIAAYAKFATYYQRAFEISNDEDIAPAIDWLRREYRL